MSILRFQNGREFYEATLTLGDDLAVWRYFDGNNRGFMPNCRFIKVTRKGFNILNLDTDRTILKTHLYMKGMAHKEYPAMGLIQGKVLLPAWLRFKVKPKEQEIAS
jgi:hypothetical protein